jgi:hypothetical protein
MVSGLMVSASDALQERLPARSGMSRVLGELRHQEIDEETSEKSGAKQTTRGVKAYEQTKQREQQQEQAECS